MVKPNIPTVWNMCENAIADSEWPWWCSTSEVSTMTIDMFPCAALLATIARRIEVRRSIAMMLKSGDDAGGPAGSDAPGKYCSRFWPISFGSGRMKVTNAMPVTIRNGSISHGSVIASNPSSGAILSAAATRSGLIARPAIEPSAT